jgi:ATP-dependent exoDNAse (exonuclease V) alpha subunit
MLRRNLLYTGVTRCTEQAVIVGRMSAVSQAVEDDREQARCTSLAERIRDFNAVMGIVPVG